MVTTTTLPTSGQFVAIWLVGAVPFSATFLWDDGVLLAYDWMADDWIVDHGYYDEYYGFVPECDSLVYIVEEE